jgi:hypothetical protein
MLLCLCLTIAVFSILVFVAVRLLVLHVERDRAAFEFLGVVDLMGLWK